MADGLEETAVMGIDHLLACRTTRRDEDRPMVRRLVDADDLAPHADGPPVEITWSGRRCTPSLSS